MEWIKDILPYVIPPLSALLAVLFDRRMREAAVVKTEAEAQRILAEAERTLAEADSEEGRNMSTIIGAWQTLFDTMKQELKDVRQEQARARSEHDRVLKELKRYKRGVDILIGQLRELGVEPRWTPDQDSQ